MSMFRRKTEDTVDVGSGVQVYVQSWGSGKPVVFVHGWPFSHRIFEYQMMKLAQSGNRAVGIDLRGFGQSDKPWDGNDYDTWASDVGKVIDALDLRDVTLVGFSMGGAIATHYVATRNDSQRVTKLALLDAAVPAVATTPEGRASLEDYIKADLADPAKFSHDFTMQSLHNPASPELVRWIDEMGTTASLRASVRGLEELRDRNLQSEMSNIQTPTRIFHGVHDQVLPFALAQVQQQAIKGAKLVSFENSGHCLMYDERDKLTEELARFVLEGAPVASR